MSPIQIRYLPRVRNPRSVRSLEYIIVPPLVIGLSSSDGLHIGIILCQFNSRNARTLQRSMDDPMKPCQERNTFAQVYPNRHETISLERSSITPCHLRIYAREEKRGAGCEAWGSTGRNGSSHVQTASEVAVPRPFCFFWPFQRDLRGLTVLLNISIRVPSETTPTEKRRRRELPSADSTCLSLIPVHSTEDQLPGDDAVQNLRATVWLSETKTLLYVCVCASSGVHHKDDVLLWSGWIFSGSNPPLIADVRAFVG